MIPDFILDQLRADNPDGVTRNARLSRCRDCGRGVLRGLDADPCGGAVTADADEIDQVGELIAILRGVRTYQLTRTTTSSGRGVWQLDPREPAAIRAGQMRPVVPAHRCGERLPPAASSRLPGWLSRRAVVPETPDF